MFRLVPSTDAGVVVSRSGSALFSRQDVFQSRFPRPDRMDWQPPEWEYAFGFSDRKSTRLNSSHTVISYAVFCLKKKKEHVAAELSHDCLDSIVDAIPDCLLYLL